MMTRVTGVIRAIYNFLAGDPIILGAVALAFILGEVLTRAAGAPNATVAIVFVGIIVGGLASTLGREIRGRRRAPR
jgi:hypothetical protein